MTCFLRCILAVSLLVGAYNVADSGETTGARAVIDKALQAIGGVDRLQKYKAATWREKGTYHGMGTPLPYTANYAMQRPMQFRMEIEGIFTMVLDGDKGWNSGMGEVRELTKEELALQRHDQRAGLIASLVPLGEKGFTLKLLDDAKVNDQPTYVVIVTHKDYPEVKLFIDKKTHLLAKSEYRTKSPEMKFKDVNQELIFSDYRDISGLKMAHKLAIKRDGQIFVEAELSDLRALEALDPKTFARPGKN